MSQQIVQKNSKGTALITGASSGIGAIYADRLARHGYDLILVARNRQKLDAAAKRVSDETGRSVRIVASDLNDRTDLARVEDVLRSDTSITTLVNNAGVGAPTNLLDSEIDGLDRMVGLNVRALVGLTHAVVPGFVNRGGGVIINIASVLGIVRELYSGVYGGSKAFVIALSRSLHKEFAGKNIRVQVVLPGATATGFFGVAGIQPQEVPSETVINADKMVDAALAGFDQGEFITIPSLPDIADWETYEAARQNLMPKLSLKYPAPRYGLLPKQAEGN
jgi:hypothetical protein